MVDTPTEQNTSTPATPTPTPEVAAVLTFTDKIKMDLKSLWNEHKLFLILFGALVLLAKFRDLVIDILVGSANREMKNTEKQDSALAAQEAQANQAANQLIEKAKEESTQAPVGDNWYEKK